jgi:hypothetical protein
MQCRGSRHNEQSKGADDTRNSKRVKAPLEGDMPELEKSQYTWSEQSAKAANTQHHAHSAGPIVDGVGFGDIGIHDILCPKGAIADKDRKYECAQTNLEPKRSAAAPATIFPTILPTLSITRNNRAKAGE